MFAQGRKLYWKATAMDATYGNNANWTLNPSGVSANGSEDATVAPNRNDTVYFNSGTNIPNIVLGTSGVECHTLICAPGVTTPYTLINGTLNVYGSILIDGNLTFTNQGSTTAVNQVRLIMQGPDNATLNLGPNAHPLGLLTASTGVFIRKTGSPVARVDVAGHNIQTTGMFDVETGSFYSNGFDITADRFYFMSVTAAGARTIDLDGSTITAAWTGNQLGGNFGATAFQNDNSFYNTYNTSDCDLILNCQAIIFNTNLEFKSLTFNNAATVGLDVIANNDFQKVRNTTLKVGTLVVNAPALTFGSAVYTITSLTVGTLIYQQPANIAIANSILDRSTPITVNIGAITTQYDNADCTLRSSLTSGSAVTTFNATAPITSNGIGYRSFTFTGSGVTASEKDDLGGNFGSAPQIVWNPEQGSKFYWKGGNGDWNNPAMWAVGSPTNPSNGCIPTKIDTVYVNAPAMSAAGSLNLPVAAACAAIYWQGVKSGAMTGSPLSIFGDADFSGANNINPSLFFCGPDPTATYTLHSGSEPVYNGTFYFQHTGTYELTSSLKMIARLPLIHYSGKIDARGDSLIIGRFESILTPVGAASRVLDFTDAVIDAEQDLSYSSTPIFNISATNLTNSDFTNSQIFVLTTGSNVATRFTATGQVYKFHDITFRPSNRNNEPLTFNTWNSGIDTCSVHRLMFDGCGGQFPAVPIVVDTLILTPNRTYSLINQNARLTINDSLISRTNDCSQITLTTAGTATISGNNLINATGKVMSIPGATISRIRYYRTDDTADSLRIPGGVRSGTENVRVAAATRTPRTFYWIGDGGDWNDPAHWAIDMPSATTAMYDGNDYSAYNAEGCVPVSTVDTVYFTANSFTQTGQVVTQTQSITIASMFWLPSVTNNPTFNSSSINASGSIGLISGITLTGAQDYTLSGTRTDSTQIFTMGGNTAAIGNLGFSGSGRYDVHGDLNVLTFTSRTGSFYSNGNNTISIRQSNIQNGITQVSGKVLDIRNSVIAVTNNDSRFQIIVNDASNFYGQGTQINSFIPLTNNSGNPILMQSYSANNLQSSGNGSIAFDKVTITGVTPSITSAGTLIADTLQMSSIGANLSIAGGKTVAINNELLYRSTSCELVNIIGTSDASRAQIQLGRCDLITYFINYQFVDVTLPNNDPDCVYTNYGVNLGSTSGIYFLTPPANGGNRLPDLFPACAYTLRVIGDPASIQTVNWFLDGVAKPEWSGQFSREIYESGDYRMDILFRSSAGITCTTQDTVRITTEVLKTWTGANNSTDWDDRLNWSPTAVPDSCSYVIIPGGLDYYPVLNNALPNDSCHTIEFQFGGEVKNTNFLTYREALVELEANSNQWYMLSAPLRNTYSGDFYVTNHNPHIDYIDGMLVYMQHFDIANYQSGTPKIDYNWNNAFNTNDIELEVGQGFALFANPRNTAYTDNDPILFPFPKDDQFHYYWSILGAPTGRGADLDRTHYGRFIYEDDSQNPPASGLVPLSHSSLADGEMVLVGNPFMAQLDFDAFYQTNQSLIYNEYKLAYGIGADGAMADFGTWKGGSDEFAGNPVATDPYLTQYIAPMQSFIVCAKQNGGQLIADIVNHTTTITAAPGASTLKSSLSNDKELLYITASRGKQKSNAVIVHWNQGDKNFRPAEDSRKLFDEKATASVLVYLLSSDGIALDIHTTNELQEMIPIGIRTSQLGKITLNFSGMEEFQNKKIQLHDTKENRIINLNEEDEYSFFKTDNALYIENRFFIVFTDDVGIDNVNNPEIFISNPTINTIRVYSSKTIEDIEILDMQGRILVRENNINNTLYDYHVNAPGVYMVRISGQTKKVVVE
jgi:hypothetical protein